MSIVSVEGDASQAPNEAELPVWFQEAYRPFNKQDIAFPSPIKGLVTRFIRLPCVLVKIHPIRRIADDHVKADKITVIIQHFREFEASFKGVREAEQMQQEEQPQYAYLYSLPGFQFCDLLLSLGQAREVRQRAAQTLEWVTQAAAQLVAETGYHRRDREVQELRLMLNDGCWMVDGGC